MEVQTGITPLMAVSQPTKNKVRPVLDYRELNNFVSSHTGDDTTDVCGDVLREWRHTTNKAAIVDFKSAYLQIKISKDLWKYQLVNYKGKTYCLTRLGFGLSSAPKIMAKILKHVLSKSSKIESATRSYIDDILVDESKISAEDLISHLDSYGFITKSPEPLDDGRVTYIGAKTRKK